MSGDHLDRSKIRPEHLERAAFVYVRQSSLKQVRENVESQRRQYGFAEQARALGIENAHLIVAAGSGGTLAGLMAGLASADSSLQVLGIDVGKLWKGFPVSIANLASELCERLEQPYAFTPECVPLIERTYVGQGYAVLSEPCVAAVKRLARQESLRYNFRREQDHVNTYQRAMAV